jgi:peptidoglycan/LPS O-acetylase OafA/YrhL
MDLAIKKFLIKLNRDIFIISLASLAIFFFIEQIKPKFVMAYLNLNHLLLICLISGIIATLFEEPANEKKLEQQQKVGFSILLILSIITFIIIMVFVWDLGAWGALVALAGGIVVFLLGKTLINDHDHD